MSSETLWYLIFMVGGIIIGFLIKYILPYINNLIHKKVDIENLEQLLTLLNVVSIMAVERAFREVEKTYKVAVEDGVLSEEDKQKIKEVALREVKSILPTIFKNLLDKVFKNRTDAIISKKVELMIDRYIKVNDDLSNK